MSFFLDTVTFRWFCLIEENISWITVAEETYLLKVFSEQMIEGTLL